MTGTAIFATSTANLVYGIAVLRSRVRRGSFGPAVTVSITGCQQA
ncbi:hypothetical protein BRUCa_0939 [Brucella melitensis]|nr:hypothetical protein BM28_A0956 [Brucella melitensis M28]AEW17905.1 hypothetical protein BAA13334_I02463 [Brucella abortus A13334]